MNEDAGPERILVIWSPQARAGDVKRLRLPVTGFRLRCGDYRVFFDHKEENTIEVTRVRDRREAYR